MGRPRTITLAVLRVLASTGPARAATVTARADVRNDGKSAPRIMGTALDVTADPGESNTMEITADEAAFRISDTTAPPAAGPGCEPSGPAEVRCARQGVPDGGDSVVIRLGDRDDSLDATDVPTTFVDLGDGWDRDRVGGPFTHVQGGAGNDVIEGGPGRDQLDGGPGFDKLHGAAGDDLLDGGDDADRDILDGGPGTDTATSSQPRATPRLVDLALQTGYGDDLTSIETADGYNRDDVLLGSQQADTLLGNGSRAGDVLDGRGGDDVLDGRGPGRDRLTGRLGR